MGLQWLLEIAAAGALVISRLAGFVVLSPFPGKWVLPRFRAALVIALALPLSVSMPMPEAQLGFDLGLGLLGCADFMVGLLIGAAFRFVLAAAEFMAGMISQASWLSAPISINPETGGQSQVLAQVAMLLAMLLALSAGVHRVVIAYLLESFHALPVGTVTAIPETLPAYIDLAGRSFDVGMRLAVPVFAVSLAVQSALALVSRVAPSLQIFNVGFAVLVASGLVTLGASLPAIAAGMARFNATLPEFLDEIMRELARG